MRIIKLLADSSKTVDMLPQSNFLTSPQSLEPFPHESASDLLFQPLRLPGYHQFRRKFEQFKL